GLAESRFVFVDGSRLSQRFLEPRHGRPFVIGELGFGTGLNFLAAWAEWEACGATAPLHFWSCEAFPLPPSIFSAEMQRIGERWPELARYAEALGAAYPPPCPGTAQRPIAEGVVLTLAYGDVGASLKAARFRADAWFLDGFAPSANPQMWTAAVMDEVAARSQPGATIATFTVAGHVREALSQAGFFWRKAPGFGRKKHRLEGELERAATNSATDKHPWFSAPEPLRRDSTAKDPATTGVAVIGAGIAGAHVAAMLDAAEWPVTILDQGGAASGASGNPAGLIMPRVDGDGTPAAYFYRDAFLLASKLYRDLRPDIFDPCGGSLAEAEAKACKALELGLWPEGQLIPSAEGSGDIFVPAAGVLKPKRAIAQLLEGLPLLSGNVSGVSSAGDGHLLTLESGETIGPFSAVVFACGADPALLPDLPINPSLGQLDIFAGAVPEHVITDGHYIAPLGDQLMSGATYTPYQAGEPVAPAEQHSAANREAADRLLSKAGLAPAGDGVASRAALRATTPDRHPIAGPLYDRATALQAYRGLAKGLRQDYPPAPYQNGLYTLCGLGSRGLVTAPILASHIVAQITGGVSPLTGDGAALVHPGRFLIRAIKRRQVPA
ncbi:MAG: FAD-dependent 5-carboxymethylaminomethyl-2-thiouridine(34) oxidoreductase MnmC, partial [Pseudomonadota bacterium]